MALHGWLRLNEYERAPKERAMRAAAITSVRAALDSQVFVVCWEEGAAMSLEQAVAYSRSGVLHDY